MYLESPSKLAALALGKDITRGDVDQAFRCVMCGHRYEGNGHHYKPSQKFNNHSDLYPSKILCGYCKTVTTGSDFILKNKCAVYFEEGVISLNKDIDIAAFLFHPPKPPFLAVYGTTKQQHLVWRTPVSQSTEMFHFRIGDYLYSVDRNVALTLACVYRESLNTLNEYREVKAKQEGRKLKPLPSFFTVPTSAIRNMNDTQAFMFSRGVTLLREQAKKDASESDEGLCQLAQKVCQQLDSFEKLLLKANYAEVFLALAATKNTQEEISQHIKNRTVKGK